MPTGYTADLYDGKEITFAEFAIKCAHAFGALAALRDDGPDAPIPVFEPSQWDRERFEKASARLAELEAWSLDQWAKLERSERESHNEYVHKTIREQADLQARYESMRAQAVAWLPPTEEHVKLRDFMIQQLEESIRFDCGVSRYLELTAPVSPEAKRDKGLAVARREVVDATKSWHDELARVEGRNAWVKALQESLTKAGA